MTVRAMLCRELTGYRDLTFEEIDDPKPGRGQVLIRVAASALNFSDTLITKGKYQVAAEPPFVPGFEAAGEIIALGEGVDAFNIGDRVLAMAPWGGFAELMVADAATTFAMPAEMPFEEAAAFPIAFGTSHLALVARGGLSAGQTLVVHGAAGGVGLTALAIGKALGAVVIATARGDAKVQVCREHGADHVIDTATETDLRGRIKALSDGQGADIQYDPVGGKTFEEALRSTRPGGTILVIGFAAGDVQQIPANILLVKNIRLVGFSYSAWKALDPDLLRSSMQDLLALYAAGKFSVHVSETYPLGDAVTAIDHMVARKSTGKIVLKP